MLIKDVIRHPHPSSVSDEDSISVALQTMFSERIRHLPVTRAGVVVGVVSERDLLAFRASFPHTPCDQPVKSIMSCPAVVIAPEATVEDAVALMLKGRIGCLPVVNGTQLAGIVTRTDILGHWQEPPPRDHVEGARRMGTKKVRDVMSGNPLRVREGDDLAFAGKTMSRTETRHLAVVNGADEVVGVLTERDILRHQAERGHEGLYHAASLAMSRPAVTVGAEESLATAQTLMLSRRLGCLPVIEQGRLVGMLTTTDLVGCALDREVERVVTERPKLVNAVMMRVPAVVTPESTLFDAVALMVDRCVRHLPVVDATRHVVGMLRDQDVRAAAGAPAQVLQDPGVRARLRETRVSAVMSEPGLTVRASATVPQVAEMLVQGELNALPVVNEQGCLVGVVSYVDIIRALL